MKLRRGVGIALSGAGLVVLSCSAERGSAPLEASADAIVSLATAVSAETLGESPAAATRIAELRARFRLPMRVAEDDRPGLAHAGQANRAALGAPTTRPALGLPVATRFEAAAGSDAAPHVRAVLPTEALRGATRAARVALPVRANDEVGLEDATSHLSVRFALENVQNAHIETAGGVALYRGALDGADVVHRVHAEGTEDFVIFDERPAREELRYSVDVSHVPGLRLVSNTLEFLDEHGSPALRVAPPYVVEATGARHDAKLAVSGCGYDADVAAPWGRPVTRPGAQQCTVHVTWSDVAYPAVVDPAWSTTGSLITARMQHTASVLASGKVLFAGGQGVATAELFDPTAGGGVGAFAATGSMAGVRYSHTASVLASGKVLVAAGYDGDNVLSASAEIFDPATGLFTATGSMATPRRDHTASVLGSGKVLLAGGGSSISSAELFDPAANGGIGAFSATGSMAGTRYGHTASVLASGKVLVAGGANGNSLAGAEIFDPAANGGAGAFTATGAMAGARYYHTASVLTSGKVLVAGGVFPNVGVATAEIFDPAANGGAGSFTATGSMAGARSSHTASVLATGKVLVAGGIIVASVEIFDPAAGGGVGAFAATGSLSSANFLHTASVLASGKVLVAGGYAGANAELYGGVVGEACVSGYCVSGVCVDGFCCNTACTGGCDRCDLAGKEGTCTVVAPSGNPGANPACVLPYACDGVSAVCPTSCASDAACAPAYYCAPNGTCLPRKAQAAACNTQTDCKVAGCRECTSGNCVDGLCCDTACSGTCQACVAALKQSGLADGTCGPIKDGIDPRSECAPAGVLCGPDGVCNGAGGCRLFTPAGVSCGAGVCQGSIARGELCNGAGTCAANAAGVECSPFLCANGGCTTTCVTSNDCAADGWCSAGTCEKRSGNGKACTTKEQCATNLCVDGFCCNALCDGQCEACDVAGTEGTCAAVSGAPHAGRAACAQGSPDEPCSAARCAATERNACTGFVGSSITCGTASCTQGTALATGTCDGKGSCQAPAPRPCGAYACNETACNETCTKDADCATGSSCDLTSSKCVSAATCDGDHMTIGATGPPQDCAPYKCDSNGTCRTECASVSDCVAPLFCDPQHHCISPSADSSGDTGCAVVATGAGGAAQLAWLSACLGLLAARRRRRALATLDGLQCANHACAAKGDGR